MTLDVQFMTMVAMALCGIYLGIAQETFRRFTPHWKSNRFLAYVMEITFWLSQVILTFYILFRVNSGELRIYVFLALLLGFSAYQVFVAAIYKRVLEMIIRIIATVYRFLKRVIQLLVITPIQFIIQLLVTIVVFIFQVGLSVLSFLAKIILSPLKWAALGIYRMLPKKVHYFLHRTAGIYSIIKNICKKGWEYLKSKRR